MRVEREQEAPVGFAGLQSLVSDLSSLDADTLPTEDPVSRQPTPQRSPASSSQERVAQTGEPHRPTNPARWWLIGAICIFVVLVGYAAREAQSPSPRFKATRTTRSAEPPFVSPDRHLETSAIAVPQERTPAPSNWETRTNRAAQVAKTIKAERAELVGDLAKTTFYLDLSTGVRLEVFTLSNPYRVVIDLPDVTFRLPAGTGQEGRGLISAFRYGLLSDGKARIVLDAVGPVLIGKASMLAVDGRKVRLAVELTLTTPDVFGNGTGGSRKRAAKGEAHKGPVASPGRHLETSAIAVPQERTPAPGTGNLLSDPEIRYCVFQNERLEAARDAIDRYSNYQGDRFNALISDYNSRCSNFRYRGRAVERIRAEISTRRSELRLQGAGLIGFSR